MAELRGRNYAKRTIARHLASLRSFFRFLYREGHVEVNPATAIPTPKLDRILPKFLDVEKVVKLLQSPDEATTNQAEDDNAGQVTVAS